MADQLIQDVFDLETFFCEQEKKGNILSKSAKLSEQARQRGNQLITKEKHDQNDHKNILLQYCKSIAFAPKDSEELAFGFSNRSILLMHLRLYEECMIDISRALEITKSDQLKSKLESRKDKCRKLMDEKNKTSDSDEPKNPNLDKDKLDISMVPSKIIPSAAESITLKYNETYGRHFIANRDIKPGEIIINEKGYASYPLYHQLHLVCSHCMGSAWNGIPCDLCPFAMFCSDECKQAAWQEYHSIECPLLKFFYFDPNIKTQDVLLATRIFIKAVKTEGLSNVMNETQLFHDGDGISRLLSENVLDSNKFRSCYNQQCGALSTDICDFLEKIFLYLIIKKTSIIDIEEKEYNDYNSTDKSLIMQLKNVFIKLRDIIEMTAFAYQSQRCNCIDIDKCHRECDANRGLLIAPCGSLLNHSCMPNVERLYIQKRKVVFYALTPIKMGEQICCSYGAFFIQDLVQRQAMLLENYHFTCRCTACNDNKVIRAVLNQETIGSMAMKIGIEFEKKYKERGSMSPFLAKTYQYWTVYNKELLEQALLIVQTIYSNFEKDAAFLFCFTFMDYILKAFNEIYGEKSVIPNQC